MSSRNYSEVELRQSNGQIARNHAGKPRFFGHAPASLVTVSSNSEGELDVQVLAGGGGDGRSSVDSQR